jgi:hypothetical protein
MSWGLVRNYEVYEDTQTSAALDEYLATTGERESVRRSPREAAPIGASPSGA